MSKILFVVTGTDHWVLNDGTKHPTGFWAEEVVAPYRAFTAAGHEVVVATPGGVVPAADSASLSPEANGGADAAADLAAIPGLRRPVALEDVDLAGFAAVFYPGGHGPMQDLAADPASGRLLTAALAAGRPIGLVCHGVAALLATAGPDGTSPFSGYAVTGFTNAEETQAGLADRAPWLLQDRLAALGVDFREAAPWSVNVVIDRNVYTGQNPASSARLAAEMLPALG